MYIPQKCDVVIIGGGPGGSMASTFLSQAGYEVVLFDKQKHPRYHVGESLIPDFWKYCDQAGVSEKIVAENFVQKAGGVVIWEEKTEIVSFKEFGYTRPALHVERDCFDNLLLRNAQEKGAQVFEEVAVRKTEFAHDNQQTEATVHYRSRQDQSDGQIKCRFVVDASGQNAVLGKQLGLRRIDEDFRFMSIWGYFENANYVAPDGTIHPFKTVHEVSPATYVSSLPGTGDLAWSWHIPLRNRTSIGLILPLEQLKMLKREGESWEEFYRRNCMQIPRMEQLLDGAQFIEGSVGMINDYSYRSTQVAGPGFFLIGDSAGFIDPIFSVGMVLAMYSAKAAAWAIDRTFQTPESLAQNQAIFADQLQGRLELGRSLALPRYSMNLRASQQAKEAMNLASSQSQALMEVAAKMTARSDNFVELARQPK